MRPLEQFAAIIAGYQTPAALRPALALHVADTVGGWIAAMRTAEGQMLFRISAHLDTMRGDGAQVSAALALNCALARLSETDDIHLAAMTTPGGVVIPAALTLAATMVPASADASDDLAAAIAAGYEAMVRLGLAIDGPTVLYRGLWPTYFAAPFAVAAVAARVMRLSPTQTAHALAGALAFGTPAVGRHGAVTTNRWWALGRAAANGLAAALAAQAGMTADLALPEHGFSIFGITPKLEKLTEAAPPSFTRTSFKPWCAARQTMAATEALKELIASGATVNEATTIEAFVPPPHLAMVNHGVQVGDRASFLTSLPYQMALAAFDPDTAVDISQGALRPAVSALMQRIKVSGDPALLDGYPSRWPARVVLSAPQGERAHAVAIIPGDPERPLTETQLRAKFLHLTSASGGTDSLFDCARAIFDDGPAQLMAGIEEMAMAVKAKLPDAARAVMGLTAPP